VFKKYEKKGEKDAVTITCQGEKTMAEKMLK